MSYKIIYILTPDHTEAGGIESLFQLADAINEQGGCAINIFENPNNDPIPNRYKQYNIKYSNQFTDSEENIFIVPEIWTPRLAQVQNCQKSIWWLSVEHNYNQFHDFQNEDLIHFCQSYYAFNYLTSRGNNKTVILNDWVKSQSFDIQEKRDRVCYNPAKGRELTEKIKLLNSDIEFVALENLSYLQVEECLSKSKVYIDFGNHPGRDRIPREAAILGNCIITNRVGSAKFYSDVTIGYDYKRDDINSVGELIKQCFRDYENKLKDFELYRNIISKQKEELFLRTKQLFL